MGQRIIRINDKLLHDLLNMPKDVAVVGFSTGFYFDSGDYALKIESKLFSDVPPDQKIPEIQSLYRVGTGVVGWKSLAPPPAPVSTFDARIVETEPVERRGREFI